MAHRNAPNLLYHVHATASVSVWEATTFATCSQCMRSLKTQPKHTLPSKNLFEWKTRRAQARPSHFALSVTNPYSVLKEPKPWTVVLANITEQHARLRPKRKGRLNWDRQCKKQLQIVGDAWTRKYNSWVNQEKAREAAERRWELRRKMAAAEASGVYLFQDEYDKRDMLKAAEKRERKAEKAKKRYEYLKKEGKVKPRRPRKAAKEQAPSELEASGPGLMAGVAQGQVAYRDATQEVQGADVAKDMIQQGIQDQRQERRPWLGIGRDL